MFGLYFCTSLFPRSVSTTHVSPFGKRRQIICFSRNFWKLPQLVFFTSLNFAICNFAIYVGTTKWKFSELRTYRLYKGSLFHLLVNISSSSFKHIFRIFRITQKVLPNERVKISRNVSLPAYTHSLVNVWFLKLKLSGSMDKDYRSLLKYFVKWRLFMNLYDEVLHSRVWF